MPSKLTVSVVAVIGPLDDPCIVHETYRKGLKVIASSWCSKQYNAADGVRQVPTTMKFCTRCVAAIEAVKS